MTGLPAGSERHPECYVATRTVKRPDVSGRLADDIWGHASWTNEFQDIEGESKPRPRFQTRAKMLWDDDFFYVGASLEEPHLCGWITEHDAVMYHDNDFEVFVDPQGRGHHYGEIEVNALNSTWDLMLTRPYRAGGEAVSGWEMHGVKTAVQLEGTLNDPADKDIGWTVEIAIPWTALRESGGTGVAPEDGEQWRVNFSRVEWHYDIVDGSYVKVPDSREDNWVWSPQYAIDMHRPERWGVVQFSNQATGHITATRLEDWDERLALIALWEAQSHYRESHGRYALDQAEMSLAIPGLRLQATNNQFEATLGNRWINHQLHFLP